MTNDYATLLYPLVESSLPKEVLRSWKRYCRRDTINNASAAVAPPETHDRLNQLLAFLELEVYDEETIEMANSSFSEAADVDTQRSTQDSKKQKKGKQGRELKENVATTSALLTTKLNIKSPCIFCESDKHGSENLMSRVNLVLTSVNV